MSSRFKDGTGYVRTPEIVRPHGYLPICRSSWLAGVRAGTYPQPIRLGRRITCWRVEDILALVEKGATDGGN